MISFDVGGTTAKMCLVEQGRPSIKHDFEAGRLRKFLAGSGLPLKVTVIDMIEIGSGGGSIAAVDALGLMKVGPRSAGSVPGPVCYNRGGTEPTVTDADLLLGCLDASYFLGGEMSLSLDQVRGAVQERLARPLGIDRDSAARGIREIVDESMAAATRMHLAEKGKDPRAYTLFAFGGAGPVHAYALARLLKLRRIIVPLGAGVISALGFLVAPPAVDEVRGYVTRLEGADWAHVNAIFAEMEAAARALLQGVGGREAEIQLRWSADMRYLGQGFEITVPIPIGPLGAQQVDAIRQAFMQTYAERFDRVVQDVDIEAINWRLSASLPAQHISLAHQPVQTPARRGERMVFFHGFGDVRTPVYDRYALRPGMRLQGPAVVEERESSCNLGPDCSFTIDAHFNLVIEIEPASAGAAERPQAEELAA